MSKTDHRRPIRRSRVDARDHESPRYQPRPAARRTGTRVGIVRFAVREG